MALGASLAGCLFPFESLNFQKESIRESTLVPPLGVKFWRRVCASRVVNNVARFGAGVYPGPTCGVFSGNKKNISEEGKARKTPPAKTQFQKLMPINTNHT